MAFVNATMAQTPRETSITRRTGNFHPNLWKDSFIQSLSSPYSASPYHERRETLNKEIKDTMNELGKPEPNPTANNLLDSFRTVDIVQCLGICRHFQKEIKLVLDYCYKYWMEEGITLDLNTTALGFRTLRLNGYHVSADVFKIFKDKDGRFFCPVTTKEAQYELRSMLNLHKASEVVFPGETIMKEANFFTSKYLQHALNEWKESKQEKTQLIMEVEYALKYPWKCSVPRWEARNYIEIFKQDNTSNTKKKGDFNSKMLELAILDFNILQCQHQSELKQVSRWWKDSRASQLDFFRHRPVELYFWYASGLFEPEFSASRIGFAKLSSLFALLDDIYDTHGTLEELKPFTTALISREIPTENTVPEYMKISLECMLETLKEIEDEIQKKQGHNPEVKKYYQYCWKNYILSYFKDAEWIASKYIPTLDEFFKNGSWSSGMNVLTIYPLLLMDTILSDEIFKDLDFPSSKFHTHPSMIVRLIDDIKDYQDEEVRGESLSSIICFKRDKIVTTNEDALNYVNSCLENYIEELTREYLESSHIPACFKNLHFNAAARGILFLFNSGDGITISDTPEMKNAIDKILIKPISL